MKIVELFVKYGIASLFGVTRFLHDENERLRLRVWQLENKLDQPRYTPSGYEDLDSESNLEDGWFDGVRELESDGSKKVVANDEVFGKTVRPKNIRRTVDDLYKEAKQRHENQFAERQLQQALEQERIVEEMVAESETSDIPTEVKISESKQRLLIEMGKSIMQKPE